MAIDQTAAEQRPAPGAAQQAQRERRVAAGDEQEDRRVVDAAGSQRFGAARRQRVVDAPRPGTAASSSAENTQAPTSVRRRRRAATRTRPAPAATATASRKPDAVADGVGDFLAERLGAGGGGVHLQVIGCASGSSRG
ncbi:MAG: hypothetical protein MZW92_19290 [Comamonadaceae bacterium]|nr:hypothetical protein [Comamonadaceae bacterium]